MIFGLGRGKIKLLIEKFNFSPGDTITGKISLDLKKPISARQLKVSLIGIQTSTRTSVGPRFGGSRRNSISSSTSRNVVYNFDMPIDGEKEYFKGEYSFEMKIPANILQEETKSEGGIADTLIKTAQIIGGGIRSRVDWHVEAALDIEKKLDIKNKVKITIG